jgi:hypothetical protein
MFDFPKEGKKFLRHNVPFSYLSIVIIGIFEWKSKVGKPKVYRVYRAWYDCTVLQAGLALYWWQRLVSFGSSRLRFDPVVFFTNDCFYIIYAPFYYILPNLVFLMFFPFFIYYSTISFQIWVRNVETLSKNNLKDENSSYIFIVVIILHQFNALQIMPTWRTKHAWIPLLISYRHLIIRGKKRNQKSIIWKH